jgi:hypothetical protein
MSEALVKPVARAPRLAVFGDSHYACLRRAHGLGIVDVSGIDLEYWGHVGGRFNFLEFRDGAIHPTDDYTAHRFAKFNAKSRRCLPAADFDMVLCVGSRTHMGPLFREFLSIGASGPFITSGLKKRMIRDHLHTRIGYRLARGLASVGQAKIVMSAVAFPTFNPAVATPDSVRTSSASDRAAIWQMVVEVAAADGITLIPQPDDTVVDGVFTKPDYAVDDYIAKNDFAHHNPAYGALIYARALAILRDTPLNPALDAP